MPSAASLFFDTILLYNGSSYGTNLALEAQTPAGTSFDIMADTNDVLYLGHSEKFDMAAFDVDTGGSYGVLTWEYYNGSWTPFIPASGRYQLDSDDSAGSQYDFTVDGVEEFPTNLLAGWTTTGTIGGAGSKYWVRVSSATSVAGAASIKRIQMRPVNAYCTTADVFNFMQLSQVLGGTDFSTTTTPTKAIVEDYIQAGQSHIDYRTRKAWRPTYIAAEYHDFNLNGFKPMHSDLYKLLSLKVWSGANWDSKELSRKGDFFFVPDTGMIHFSRYFILPARFASYNAPIWRWGGGEFTTPIKIEYLAGRDFHTDQREAGIVFDCSRKLAAIDIIRSGDFGNIVVSGADRVMAANRADSWGQDVEERLESLRAFEVF